MRTEDNDFITTINKIVADRVGFAGTISMHL